MRWAATGLGGLYRAAWWATAAAAAVVGLAAGWFGLGAGGALMLLGSVACLAGVAGWHLRSLADRPPAAGKHTAVGLLCGGIALAVTGLTSLLGPAGWWISVLVALAGWPALGVRRPARSPAGQPSPEAHPALCSRGPAVEALPVQPLPQLPAAPSLSTPQLCWAWRVSYLLVDRSTGAGTLHRLAHLRRGYLDELQRRDPAAFDR